MENRRRQVDLLERIIRVGSKISEITEYANEIPADIRSAEAKPHEDLSTRNKDSWRDAAAVWPASPPVFGNEKNTAEVSSVHKTQVAGVVFSSSMIPAQVTSVAGLTVGSIMLGDVSPASVHQEWAAAAKEVHDAANGRSRPQQTKKSGKDQHSVLPVENPLRNVSVMCAPIKQPSKKEQPKESGMNLAAPTQSTGNHIIGWENVMIAERTEMERYAHKPAYKEPHQQNLWQILPAENHTASYDSWENPIWGSRVVIKKHLIISPLLKLRLQLSLTTGWIGKLAAVKGGLMLLGTRGTDGSATVVPNLAEQSGNSHVANVVQESSDLW